MICVCMKALVRLMLRWLFGLFPRAQHRTRQLSPFILGQMARQGVPRLVGACQPNLQKEGLATSIVLHPSYTGIANENVRVEALFFMPRHTLVFDNPIGVGSVAKIGAFDAMQAQKAPPIIVSSPMHLREIGRIFDNHPFVEAARHIARAVVHLAHVDTVITGLVQVLHPNTVLGPVLKSVDTRIVGIHAREDCRTRTNASGPRTIRLAK